MDANTGPEVLSWQDIHSHGAIFKKIHDCIISPHIWLRACSIICIVIWNVIVSLKVFQRQ